MSHSAVDHHEHEPHPLRTARTVSLAVAAAIGASAIAMIAIGLSEGHMALLNLGLAALVISTVIGHAAWDAYLAGTVWHRVDALEEWQDDTRRAELADEVQRRRGAR